MKFEDLFINKNSSQLTGDELIEKLKESSQDKNVYFASLPHGLHGKDKYPVNDFFSWRGSYSEPSIWSSGAKVYTVSELIDRLNQFFGSIQTGWKGGEFEMRSDSLLWCDPEGSFCERGVRGVFEDDGHVYIVVDQFKH